MRNPHQHLAIVVRDLADGEDRAVADLVMRTFGAYVGHEYGEEGIAEFAAYAEASAMRDRLDSGECLVLIAEANDQIVGMIEFRGADHLSLLFVDHRFHRRGVARALFDGAIERLAGTGTGSPDVEVNSSRYAISVYRRLGFEITGQEQTVNGITFTPMRRAASQPEQP